MDFRHALRQLRRDPAFALLAILILGLGIGANTALFSVINGVLLRPLPYPQPDRIVALTTGYHNRPSSSGWVSGPDFADWRDRSSAFEAVAAYNGGEGNAVAQGIGLFAEVQSVSRGYDRVFGVPPSQGRWFTPEEEAEGGPPVAVISSEFAQRAFRGNALGAPLKISERVSTVIGVMPRGFRFPGKTDIWTPSGTSLEHHSRTGHNWQVAARMKPGVTFEQASSQMGAIGEQLARQYPSEDGNKQVRVTQLKDRLVRDVRLTLLVLFGAVALVLFIACANLANLLLAKASTRDRELAVRAALGAGHGRILRQLLSESALLGVGGAVVGIAFGFAVLKIMIAMAPANLPRLEEVRMDPLVLLFTGAITIVATLAFGLVPALKTARMDLQHSLTKSGGRGSTAGRLPRVLVVGEVALASMLAIGAALLIRSLAGLVTTDLGYAATSVLVTDARTMFANDEPGAVKNVRWYEQTLSEIRGLPGVQSAAGILGFPGWPLHSNGTFWTQGGNADQQRPDSKQSALFTVVTPGYFSTLGIPLDKGRDFSERDMNDAPFVAVVNEALVRQAFQGAEPIGRQIRCGLDSPKWMTIVGVVGDSRTLGAAARQQAEIYMPAMQHPRPAQWMSLVTRAQGPPTALHEPIRHIVARRDPEAPVKFTTLTAVLADGLAPPRFRTTLLSTMAALAVLLAMAGVYGVTAYGVKQRTAEFGVRIAVGATSGDIVRLVLSEGGLLVGLGLAIGLAGALAAATSVESLLVGVSGRDPLTYIGVAVVLACVALVANLSPALRASRVDPMSALRQE